MPRNSSITAFFRPVPKSSQNSQSVSSHSEQPQLHQFPQSPQLPRAPSRAPVSPALGPPSSPPQFLSSSPPGPTVVRGRDAVIRGSDEEDDEFLSSDDDLPDIFGRPGASGTGPGTTTVPVPPTGPGLLRTPRAKRPALEFLTSPLTIMPKHKFDIKALMKHAEADSAVEASEQRMESILARETAQADSGDVASTVAGYGGGASKADINLYDTMLDVFSDAEDSEEESTRNKLLRAVKRTQAGSQRKQWRFFHLQDRSQADRGGLSSIEARTPFPRSAAKGTWEFLAPKGRSEFFEDGLPFNIQTRMQNLPDEIFLWVLREVPFEKSRKLREEYIRLLNVCPEQAGRLVDEDLVEQLFRDVGASEMAFRSPPQPTGDKKFEEREIYLKRDWTPLRSVLQVLVQTSPGLGVESLTRSVTLLLRLGMDELIHEDQAVTGDFDEALQWLVHFVPKSAWDSFCGNVCASLHSHVEEASLHCDAVTSIPLLTPRLVELRRRLALVCVFGDPQHALAPPQTNFSMRAVIDRLDADEFLVDRNHTDFYELAALTELLGIAIGDGNPPRPLTPNGTMPSSKAIRQYNADVDEVSRKVKIMWSNIHERGAADDSRLDVRVKLKDLERKLQHATRTRPPPKANIFGIEEIDEDEVDRPRQQRFMQRFLRGGKGRNPS
ncbi:hypothetical protein B0H67DRAFT_596091 [Lasiosphaeris hirsuta]|uniref:Uncharacterized protein n=1 Tax=Lasiosphaeris hirsuta TaxID=260670 RepID=A0AA40EBY7_9PEZI|nr:hypothetical protein B0H67DRAFT_596091 [Lasiosphaeris hirsuta]